MAQRLADHRGHDSPIIQAHPRAVRVEDADDAGVHAMFPMVRHGQRLGEAFGLVVTTARADWIYIAPVLLGLRMDQWISIDLPGRSQQNSSAFILAQAQ